MSRANLDARLNHLLEDKPEELPDAVRSRIELTLARLPDRRPALRLWRPWVWGTAAAAVTALAVLGSAFVSPAAAAQLRHVPGAASVFRLAGDFGLKAADEKGLVTTVDQQADDQGIELRISEALYDGTRLSIGYLQTATGQPGELESVRYAIDGKPVSFAGSQSGSRMDEHTYAGVINLTPETELPENFDVTMTVSRIGGKEGKWAFTFPVRRMTSTNTVVMPMKTQSSGDLTLTVRKIVFTPSSTELDVQIKQPKSFDRFINYDLVDDQGVVFERRSGGGGGRTEGDFEIADFKQLFGPAQKIPPSVTVRPVIEGGPEASVPLKETRVPMESAPDEEHPLVLSQGETGQLKITQVEFLKDKTLVHYQTEGSQPFLQSTQLWIEDETGRKHLLLDRRTETVDPGRHMFLREFPPFRPDQKLTFVTRELPVPNYAEGLEMTIPIQK